MLLRTSPGWFVLNLPAIADEEERIQIGEDEYHLRNGDDILHAEREPLSVLESPRTQLGSDTFAAQYSKGPFRPGAPGSSAPGCRYETLPEKPWWRVIQSWDTASKEGAQNDWSVCTTWLVHERRYYLLNVLRSRLNYPSLKARAIGHAEITSRRES
jgi:hypothetical protein